jgi:hypothetical protein
MVGLISVDEHAPVQFRVAGDIGWWPRIHGKDAPETPGVQWPQWQLSVRITRILRVFFFPAVSYLSIVSQGR